MPQIYCPEPIRTQLNICDAAPFLQILLTTKSCELFLGKHFTVDF